MSEQQARARSGHFRLSERVAVSLAVAITHEQEGWRRDGTVVDLGLGGACLELEDDVDTDSPVTLELTAPALWDPLMIRARVAWCRRPDSEGPARVGCEFDLLPAPKLRSLVEILRPDPYD